jgi:hypothetical protein
VYFRFELSGRLQSSRYTLGTNHTITAKMAPLRTEHPSELVLGAICIALQKPLPDSSLILSFRHHSHFEHSDRRLIIAGKVMSHLVGRSASQASLSLAFLAVSPDAPRRTAPAALEGGWEQAIGEIRSEEGNRKQTDSKKAK